MRVARDIILAQSGRPRFRPVDLPAAADESRALPANPTQYIIWALDVYTILTERMSEKKKHQKTKKN